MTIPTPEQMAARALDIHARNVLAGWWDAPRPPLSLVALIHSEISEALEGDRKGLMDDKLPHRPMVEVELADTEIRLYDFAGGMGLDLTADVDEDLAWQDLVIASADLSTVSENLGFLHFALSGMTFQWLSSSDEAPSGDFVVYAICFIHHIAEKFGFDVDGAREEKLIFNASREDHKREVRAAEGGKRY